MSNTKTVIKMPRKVKIRTITDAPTRKVKAAGVAGLLAIVAQWGLGKLGVSLPAELLGPLLEQVVGAVGGPLFTLVSSLVAAYFTSPGQDDQITEEAG